MDATLVKGSYRRVRATTTKIAGRLLALGEQFVHVNNKHWFVAAAQGEQTPMTLAVNVRYVILYRRFLCCHHRGKPSINLITSMQTFRKSV